MPAGTRCLQRTLVVEGWRFTCHSYAIVNQWQLLALLRRSDLKLRVRDLPYHNPDWPRVEGLFERADETALAGIPLAAAGDKPQATLRITAPYDFTLAGMGRTAVVGTAEFRVLPPFYLAGMPDIARLAQEPRFRVITPSHWSAQGFLRLGLRPEQVAVVPHGVDVATFHPSPESRERVRKSMGLSNFVFLHIGAMTGNKGIDVLLRAFAMLAAKASDVTLFLKGVDGLYSSAQMIDEAMARLPAQQQQLINDRLIYNGDSLSMKQIAALYRACDAYVSPYRGEGFNLPVLEAAASGLPVICTAGGSTDDFVTDEFARKIRSRIAPIMLEGVQGDRLDPDAEHLYALMADVVENDAWRRSAALAGPKHTAVHYTWGAVAQKLVDVLF
jgi:glycosyltransferase involved in cell wall biosynthesis